MKQLEVRFYGRAELAEILQVDLKNKNFARQVKNKLMNWGYSFEYFRKGVNITRQPQTAQEKLAEIKSVVGNLTVGQFELEWRGNPCLEIGDKIFITTKDNEVLYSYVLDDVIEYDGGYKQTTQWAYDDSENEETETEPITIGDKINQTVTKVDKINKQIKLIVGAVSGDSSNISSIEQDVESIKQAVQEIKEKADSASDNVEKLTKRVESTMTSEQIKYTITSELEKGTNKVTTATGFTFDENGLTVSKTDQEMKTTITENGMTVYKDNDDVLVANNEGVKAVNLYASTYLIIGNNSRFEDYGSSRTGCFWIGG